MVTYLPLAACHKRSVAEAVVRCVAQCVDRDVVPLAGSHTDWSAAVVVVARTEGVSAAAHTSALVDHH